MHDLPGFVDCGPDEMAAMRAALAAVRTVDAVSLSRLLEETGTRPGGMDEVADRADQALEETDEFSMAVLVAAEIGGRAAYSVAPERRADVALYLAMAILSNAAARDVAISR